MARPRKEIDQKQFENLCGLQCTKEEICSFFETTDKTLEAWCKRTYNEGFSDVFRKKRGKGRIALRRHQWQLAEKNASMAIFLGKQYLNQKDNPETEEKLDAISDNLKSLAEILKNPAPNRDIEEFEE